MAKSLTQLVRLLHEATEQYAVMILTQSVRDGVSEIRIGPPGSRTGEFQAPDWPSAANAGFDIAVRHPDGRWYQMVQPGVIFRDALLHYLTAHHGTDWRVHPPSSDGSTTITRQRAA